MNKRQLYLLLFVSHQDHRYLLNRVCIPATVPISVVLPIPGHLLLLTLALITCDP
jgi:hypothetical protein